MLLDGHPQLNVFPFEHWNRSSKNKVPERRIEMFDRLSVDDKLETAGAAHVERKLARLHPQTLVTDVMRAWRAETTDAATLPAMYERLARSYFPATGRSPDRVVVNHCGSLCRFTREQIDAVFGAGTHLLTIRDPRAAFSSMQGLLHRKFTIEQAQKSRVSPSMIARHVQKLKAVDSISGYLREFCQGYRHMVARYAACPDVIRMRFEDLVMAPEASMRRLAVQLGIDWNPGLLEPTEFGAAHAPNSSFARRGGTIHGEAAHDWTGRIAASDRDYIENTLTDEMAALGYQRLANGSPVLPVAPLLGND